MQAIILAAGMGKRLRDLTSNTTKCMVKVNGITLVERALRQLDRHNLSRIVIVIGYEGQKLVDFTTSLSITTPVVFVRNDIYDKTNNIYSLFLAKDYLLREDTLLLESDLIFEDAVLCKLLDDPYPCLVLVDDFESWMDGTVVTLDVEHNIKQFIGSKDYDFENLRHYYKTVNIYKFSKNFSTSHYVPFLEAYCKALGHNEYYEQVLKVITLLKKPEIKALPLQGELWYEIDDKQDLDIAESIFAPKTEKTVKIEKRYGGYWRYPQLLDFCYLVNPYFPNRRLKAEMKANFDRLIGDYPSGMEVNCILAAKNWGLSTHQVVVGNGAAELIKTLLTFCPGKIGLIYPTFEEYPNRKAENEIVPYYSNRRKNYNYTIDDLIDFYKKREISTLVLINPDNPSGNFIPTMDIIRLNEWCSRHNIRLIVDESFIDFADSKNSGSLLDHDLLNTYPNIITVKSISKSFGVPGLRLGILASGDKNIISNIKKEIPVWNINSFAEFFLQIFEKYSIDYWKAIELSTATRKKFIKDLKRIPGLKVLPSQGNFIMCKLPEPLTARSLKENLLFNANILIKDLAEKKGVNGEYIRIAVKKTEENALLIKALKNEIIRAIPLNSKHLDTCTVILSEEADSVVK